MIDAPNSIEVALAAFQKLEADLARAIAACEAEHAQGRIGYEEYLAAKALKDKLLSAGQILSGRINEALETLLPST